MGPRLSAAVEYTVALAIVTAVVAAAGYLWEPVRVSGASMSPALHPGDLVLVRRGAQPRAQAIVLVRAPGHRAVLHRVLAVRADGSATTKGDANDVADREVASAEHIDGVVTRVLPVGVLLARWRGTE